MLLFILFLTVSSVFSSSGHVVVCFFFNCIIKHYLLSPVAQQVFISICITRHYLLHQSISKSLSLSVSSGAIRFYQSISRFPSLFVSLGTICFHQSISRSLSLSNGCSANLRVFQIIISSHQIMQAYCCLTCMSPEICI